MQDKISKLQNRISILKGLAESYAGGGSMTENIDKIGGAGTGAFAKEVIDIYINM